MQQLAWLSAQELARGYRSGEISPVDAVEASLSRIDAVGPAINCMVTTTADAARAEAKAAEVRLRSGEELPLLFGVPITVKDLTDTAGVRTTYGTVTYRDHVPAEDALEWARIKATGAILVGKTTTPEYGMLGITQSKLTGNTSTPWRIGYNSGGSSGGSAASVAAGIVPVSWGSDGGGSIRVPAALCGAVGIKPTVGRVPHRDNDDPDGTEGPLARTVLDAAVLLDATAGRHPRDRFSIPSTGERFAEAAIREGDLTGIRIAASPDLGQGPIDPDIRAAFEDSLDTLRGLGAVVDDVAISLPDTAEFFLAYWGAEFVAFVDEMDHVGQPVWGFIRSVANRAKTLHPITLSNAMRTLKTTLYNGYADVFDRYDAIVTPTTPITARPHPVDGGHPIAAEGPIAREVFELHRLTEPPSHAGLPAITVPGGFSEDGLPIGLQIVTPMYEDSRAIFIASRYENATPWHLRRPTL